MTSKERMNIAMRRGKPDRVPFMCQLSIGHMLKNSSVRPVEIWNSAEGFARAATECCTRYRMDGLLINVWPEDRCWRDKIESIESREEVDRVTWRDGRIVNYYTNGNVIEERADARLDIEDVLDALDASQENEALIATEMYDVLDIINSGVGQSKSVHWEIQSPYLWHTRYCHGLDSSLSALILAPEKCHRFSLAALDRTSEIANGAIDRNCDAIVISSPYAGGSFISRSCYEEFVLRYEKELIRRIHEHASDMPVYIHTCGFLGDRLDLMLESGCDGIECLDPPPLGNVNLEDAVKTINGRGFIKGNIDSVNCLLRCTSDEIRADAESRIAVAGTNGGYILSTSCSVAPNVPRAALDVLYEVACTAGAYRESHCK